jgi:hypothetical protein
MKGTARTVFLTIVLGRSFTTDSFLMKEQHMTLLVTYLITVFCAVFGIAALCVALEQWTSPFTSLAAFFPLFFLTIWVAWVLSVKLTNPKPTPTP